MESAWDKGYWRMRVIIAIEQIMYMHVQGRKA